MELIFCVAFLVFATPALRAWNKRLNAAGAMDTMRPTSDEVAATEADLPHMPGDPHYSTFAEHAAAVAAYREHR